MISFFSPNLKKKRAAPWIYFFFLRSLFLPVRAVPVQWRRRQGAGSQVTACGWRGAEAGRNQPKVGGSGPRCLRLLPSLPHVGLPLMTCHGGSSVLQALIAEPLAPASDEALREQPYRPMPPDVLQFVPETPVALAGSAV